LALADKDIRRFTIGLSAVWMLGRFRGFGLSLTVSGIVLSILTYLLLGLVPLLALWIAFTIVGLSIFLTPEEVLVKPSLLAVVEDSFSNLSSLFEFFSLGSYATYVCYDDGVYIYVSEKPLQVFPESPPKSLLVDGFGRVFALRSPLSSMVKDLSGDLQSASYHVLVEVLEAADGVECYISGEDISCLVRKPYVSSPARLEGVVGSIYGMCLASIASKVYGRPVMFVREERAGRDRLIVLRVM
jgi:hypothetical protein